MNRQQMPDIKEQREQWTLLGEQLSHIITEDELVRMLTVELPDFQLLEAAEDEVEVDVWWAQVAGVTLGGERQFPILSRLALALCTIYNSSSEVERDFSDMEAVYTDPRANATGQQLLEAKMTVKSAVKEEAYNCARCKVAKEERKEQALAGEKLPREQCNHCHCKFLEVDDELLADLRNCGPSQRFELNKTKASAESKRKSKENNSEEVIKKNNEDICTKLKKETLLMKKRYLEKKEKEARNKKEVTTKKDKEDNMKPSEKKAKKRVSIEKIETSERKKKKLFSHQHQRSGKKC
jgi:hypothetical protein